MKSVMLGNTGIRVSTIGFGAMHLSIKNRPDEAQAVEVIHRALDLGVTLIDTAQAYRSSEGLPVYADHEYALVASYNNTRGEPSDAMAILYIGLYDKDFDANLLRDAALRERRREERELAAFERRMHAVEEDPEDPEARYFAGLALFQRGDVARAKEQLLVGERLKPDDPRIARALARVRQASRATDAGI